MNRFGHHVQTLIQRIKGKDFPQLTPHKEASFFKESFYPQLERALSQELSSEDLFDRIHSMFKKWEQRLHARSSVICGFDISCQSHEHKPHFRFRLSKPTQEASTLYRVFQELWFEHIQKIQNEFSQRDFSFEEEIEEIHIQSTPLERHQQSQLNLFDPEAEDKLEKWNELVSKLEAKSSPQKPVKVGFWKPQESYLPEDSFEWLDWNEAGVIPVIQDHPQRPSLLLKKPQRLTSPFISKKEDFFAALKKDSSLKSIEYLSDIWAPQSCPKERIYARFKDMWVFWDKKKQGAFVHGYFDHFEAHQVNL